MISNNYKYLAFAVLMMSLCFLTTACSSFKMSTADERELLKERVITEWQLKKNGEWKNIYDLTTSEYRETHSKEKFLNRTNVSITDYTIERIDISEEGKKATVKVRFTVLHMGLPFNFTANETWIKENGNWYLDIIRPMEKQ